MAIKESITAAKIRPVKVSTLRSRGFRITKLTGNQTWLRHDKPFTVFGRKASLKDSEYEYILNGQWNKEIPRDIKLLERAK